MTARPAFSYGRRVAPKTRYAKSGDVSIAYQVVGDGPDLVLVPGFVSHVEAAWDWPYLARFLHRLSSFSRLIVFDKRGTGLSDPMKRPPTLEERMEDIRAVMDASGVQSAPLFGISEGGSLSIALATTYPERTSSLLLYGSFAKKLAASDYPWGVSPSTLKVFLDSFDEAWATGEWWDIANPSTSIDRSHRESWARYLRVAASPGMARDMLTMNAAIDVRHLLANVHIPTLVLHRTDDRWVEFGNGRYLAEHIEGATLIELPGDDHRAWLGDADAVIDEVETFITGSRKRTRRSRTKAGPEALSARELEVVRLAIEGETTPDIARRLFLSERTIESHLGNAYGKLGVRSRLELVRRAEELDL
jgi:pimeloyl-ACP methyl ester carboxylesterase/DNA-binding CsgD family transcriptional regulator